MRVDGYRQWLPKETYHELAWFERERRELFGRSWFFGCAEIAAANAGDFATVTRLDQTLFVVRDGEGRHRSWSWMAALSTNAPATICANVAGEWKFTEYYTICASTGGHHLSECRPECGRWIRDCAAGSPGDVAIRPDQHGAVIDAA